MGEKHGAEGNEADQIKGQNMVRKGAAQRLPSEGGCTQQGQKLPAAGDRYRYTYPSHSSTATCCWVCSYSFMSQENIKV